MQVISFVKNIHFAFTDSFKITFYILDDLIVLNFCVYFVSQYIYIFKNRKFIINLAQRFFKEFYIFYCCYIKLQANSLVLE